MYDFINERLNTVKGSCPYACKYCYMKRWGDIQKPLRLDQKELKRNLARGKYVFVCSGCDLFHPCVPWAWIADTLRVARDFYPENTYLFHTKNPARVLEIPMFQFPKESILCATIETNRDISGISLAPSPQERAAAMREWRGGKMITAEPLMDFDVIGFADLILSCNPAQVNIGADSGKNGLPEPSADKIAALIEVLKTRTIVKQKTNLARIYKRGMAV
jgi:protein gp37